MVCSCSHSGARDTSRHDKIVVVSEVHIYPLDCSLVDILLKEGTFRCIVAAHRWQKQRMELLLWSFVFASHMQHEFSSSHRVCSFRPSHLFRRPTPADWVGICFFFNSVILNFGAWLQIRLDYMHSADACSALSTLSCQYGSIDSSRELIFIVTPPIYPFTRGLSNPSRFDRETRREQHVSGFFGGVALLICAS